MLTFFFQKTFFLSQQFRCDEREQNGEETRIYTSKLCIQRVVASKWLLVVRLPFSFIAALILNLVPFFSNFLFCYLRNYDIS